MRIAIDMDSTLAAVSDKALTEIGYPDMGYEDIDNWNLEGLEPELQTYIDQIHDGWAEDPLEYPLMDDTVVESMHGMYTHPNSMVDVVTAQPEREEVVQGKKEWLEYHNIPYDKFRTVPMDTTKAEFRYDIYVDDKPDLPSRVQEITPMSTVYVYDHPYNRGIDAPHTRVERLRGAAVQIIDLMKWTDVGEAK